MFTVFIVVMVVLAYAWILYPGLMLLVSRTRPATPGEPVSDDEAPEIAILLSAHNEEKVIGARLANLTTLHYPHDRFTIHVGLDGCTDRTASIVRGWAQLDSRIHVASTDVCQGKTRMLKRLAGELLSCSTALPPPYLLFTDANTIFEREAVRRLVARFSDPHVGGVCGKLVFVPSAASPGRNLTTVRPPSRGTDESTYWDLETRLKEAESRLDSCLGANGAIYAIRRELFPLAMPENVIIDDFVIGMKVREQGFRMIFEPLA
ncbi:MAG: glycosyltransferase, partial [bacterium]